MNRMGPLTAVVAIACVALCTADADAYKVRSLVLAGGGTPAGGITSAGKVHRGTLGQPLVGRVSGSGYSSTGGVWPGGGSVTVSVEPIETTVPMAMHFGRPWPNPSRGTVSFDLALPTPSRVHVEFFDVQGRAVGSLDPGTLGAGVHRIGWSGRGATPGVYLARLSLDGRSTALRRFVLVE